MKQKYLFILLPILAVLSACEPTISNKPAFENGALNASSYLAIGDDWTAGISNNGLNVESQQYAFPNLLAQQLALVAGGTFKQPLLPEGNGSGQYYLAGIDSDICPETSLLPILGNNAASPDWENNVWAQGAFNNLGVQRMTLKDIANKDWSTLAFQNIDSLNNNGPYLQRLVNPAAIDTTSYLDLVESTVEQLQPTFFTSWFGFSDALLYAASGGGLITGDPLGTGFQCDLNLGNISPNQLTDNALFEANYRLLLDKIITHSVDTPQGILMTLPLITRLPYFSAINNALKYRPETQVLNTNWLDTLYVRRVPNCDEFLPLYGKSGGDTIQANFDDFPLLNARLSLGKTPAFSCETGNNPHGLDYNAPLLDSEFLDKDEELQARARIASFNQIIKDLGVEYNFLVIDMNAFLTTLQTGYTYNGIAVNADYLTGNFYSLDGLHFTPMGNAIVANHIITQMNVYYQANIPLLEIANYPAISYP